MATTRPLLAVVLMLVVATPLVAGQSATGDATVFGRIVESDSGVPARSARVLLLAERSTSIETPHEIRAVTADEDGRFVITDVAAGRFHVWAEKPGFVLNPDDVPSITIAAGQSATEIDVRLSTANILAGRVVDVSGEPLAGITVTAVPLIERRRGERAASGLTSITTRDGDFRIAGVPPGQYVVQAATARGRQQEERSAVEAKTLRTYYPGTSDREVAQIFTLGVAEMWTGLDFMLLTQ